MYTTISIVFGTVHYNRTVLVLRGKESERETERERQTDRERTLAPDFTLSSILSALL